jgi:hypothetical protein
LCSLLSTAAVDGAIPLSSALVERCISSNVIANLLSELAACADPAAADTLPHLTLCAAALGRTTWARKMADPGQPLDEAVSRQVVEALCLHPGALEGYLRLLAHPGSLNLDPSPWVLLEYASWFLERSPVVRGALRRTP